MGFLLGRLVIVVLTSYEMNTRDTASANATQIGSGNIRTPAF